MTRVYIQSVVGETCDVCPKSAVGEVKNLMTDETITTLCDTHLEEEGWL